MSNVTVSVVLCTYNGAAFVARQIDTVLAQTRPADEIIIQDDGSTDATMDILNDYARRFPVIRVFRNATPLGVNANFYSAMERSRGDYIAICDQDDLWETDKLARQLAAIGDRSEEHTSELQSRQYLVCRLLLEKKKQMVEKKQLNLVLLRHLRERK